MIARTPVSRMQSMQSSAGAALLKVEKCDKDIFFLGVCTAPVVRV
jgi:hypothetical protein